MRADSLPHTWRSACTTSGSYGGCLTVSIRQSGSTRTFTAVPVSNPASLSQLPFSVTAGKVQRRPNPGHSPQVYHLDVVRVRVSGLITMMFNHHDYLVFSDE
ncbi:hypothetical protein EPYR_03804 [Erwinia pyrifoliae DSM 12163]|nr:uncharacterized protein EpC_35370 [Erwinia pyrifoliae Ep1/96]CAY76184.1 hypothetical protein EPYR_03804 [Erwinia pyrifoliae DSM 12163]